MGLEDQSIQQKIEQNIVCCDNLLDILASMSDSDANQQNTWLKIGDIESEVIELKMLYKQIIL